jgi:hypothetical protein
LITHSARSLLPWFPRLNDEKNACDVSGELKSVNARRRARLVLAHSFGCVTFLIYHCLRKVNYLRQNDSVHFTPGSRHALRDWRSGGGQGAVLGCWSFPRAGRCAANGGRSACGIELS